MKFAREWARLGASALVLLLSLGATTLTTHNEGASAADGYWRVAKRTTSSSDYARDIAAHPCASWTISGVEEWLAGGTGNVLVTEWVPDGCGAGFSGARFVHRHRWADPPAVLVPGQRLVLVAASTAELTEMKSAHYGACFNPLLRVTASRYTVWPNSYLYPWATREPLAPELFYRTCLGEVYNNETGAIEVHLAPFDPAFGAVFDQVPGFDEGRALTIEYSLPQIETSFEYQYEWVDGPAPAATEIAEPLPSADGTPTAVAG